MSKRYCTTCEETTGFKRTGNVIRIVLSVIGVILLPIGLLLLFVWAIPARYQCTKCKTFLRQK